MKLASLKSGRDGALAVVSRDLARAAAVPTIAPSLQAASRGALAKCVATAGADRSDACKVPHAQCDGSAK